MKVRSMLQELNHTHGVRQDILLRYRTSNRHIRLWFLLYLISACISANWELGQTQQILSLSFLKNSKRNLGCSLLELRTAKIDILSTGQSWLWYWITQLSTRTIKSKSSSKIERSWLLRCLSTLLSLIRSNWCFGCWNHELQRISNQLSKIST